MKCDCFVGGVFLTMLPTACALGGYAWPHCASCFMTRGLPEDLCVNRKALSTALHRAGSSPSPLPLQHF